MAAAERKVLHVRIATPLHDRLVAVADERVVGTSLLVERAIEQYLDRLPVLSNGTST